MKQANTRGAIGLKICLHESVGMQRDAIRKILLLKLDHIGDFITAIPAFRLLRQTFVAAEITLICLPALVDLAQATGLFNLVRGFAFKPDSGQLGAVPSVYREDHDQQFMNLLNGIYDLAADFKYDADTRLLLDLVDTQCRAGFAAPTQKGLDMILPQTEWDVPFTNLSAKNLPLPADTRLTLLAQAIIDRWADKAFLGDVFALPDDVRSCQLYQRLKNQARMKIGISLGAGSELRQWPVEYWAALLPQLIQAYDAQIIFFGSKADQEQTQQIGAILPQDRIVNLTGVTALAHAPHYMMLLDAYIGCDTGLTHMAAGLDIPTVDIYAGISNISVWHARGKHVKNVYAEVICAPCHLRFKTDCPNNTICMKAIGPQIVYACFEQLIAHKKQA